MGSLISIPAAVYVWNGLQDIGEGVREAAKSASADTALRILYDHQPNAPGAVIHEAEPSDRVTPLPAPALSRT
jgi:hypothetical protein